jgi:hypothetical protein
MLVCFGLPPFWYSVSISFVLILHIINRFLHQYWMDWTQRASQACRLQPAIRIRQQELVPCLPCRPRHHICEFVSLFVLSSLFSNLHSHDGMFHNLCSGSPVFWIGIGVALSAAFSVVRNSAFSYSSVCWSSIFLLCELILAGWCTRSLRL